MESSEQSSEINEAVNVSNYYVMNDKQIFNDTFMPTKSVNGVWVQFAASGQTNSYTGSTLNIQFNQCGPKNFSDVMKNIRFRCELYISYTLGADGTATDSIPYEYIKGFNYCIKQCTVNINGNVTRTLSPCVLASIYENYNTKYCRSGFDNFWGKDNTILKSRVKSANNMTCTETYLIDTPIYHPYLTAPYLGGINNMSVDLNFNMMNLPIFEELENGKNYPTINFTITKPYIYYQTYKTNNELFNIAIPEFEQTLITAQNTGIDASNPGSSVTVSTTDLNSAPMKYFIIGLNNYSNTAALYDEGVRITNATLNFNNIYNAVKTDSIAGLYEISKYSGYKRSFSEFANYNIANLPIGDGDEIIEAPHYSSNKWYTYNPQCICIDIKSLDIDTGTTDIFRFDGTIYYENTNGTVSDHSSHYIAVVRCYYSLFSSSKIQTNIIKSDNIMNRQALIQYDAYDDFLGFGFFDKIKGGFNKMKSWLTKNKPVTKLLNVATPLVNTLAPQAAPVVNTIKTVSDSLGFGTVAF